MPQARRKTDTYSAATLTVAAPCPCVEDAPETNAVSVGEVPVPSTHAEDTPVTPGPAGAAYWSGVIGVEGELTGDGRLIEPNALVWENLPLPIRYVPVDVGAHDGAQVVGHITSITRGQGGAIIGEGDFDLASPVGQEAYRQVREGLTTGISMDLDDVSFEVRVASELVDGDPLMDMLLGDPEDGSLLEEDEDGRVVIATINSDDEVRVTTSGRIRAATIVAIPAFSTAQIHTVDTLAFPPSAPAAPAAPTVGMLPNGGDCSCTEGDEGYDPACDCMAEAAEDLAAMMPGMNPSGTPCSCTEGDADYDPDCSCGDGAPAPGGSAADVVTAGAPPISPPAEWFSRPVLSGPTGLTVTPEGRVYGHLAQWGTCHISHTHTGCITPPHSAASYAYFHTGTVLTSGGGEVPVGHITLDTRHAGERLTPAATLAHYENTGTVVADIVAGEDEHGIWVSGAVRPGTTETQIRALRAAPLSGDWRRIGAHLELVAALAVNVPGFPVPRPRGLVAGGVVRSLVASGMVSPRRVRPYLSREDLSYLKRLADRERARDLLVRDKAAAMARRVAATSLVMRAHRRLEKKES